MKVLTTVIALMFLACGAPRHATDNTEVVTTYFGKEAQRVGGKWSSQHWIKTRIEQPGKFVVIFAAGWCETCNLLEKGISGIDLHGKEVYWVNLDEPWARKVASLMHIKTIPLAIVMDNRKQTHELTGPAQILVYLLTDY